MRRKEPHLTSNAHRGKSLISTRIQQHQQRKTQNMKSQLPRSYSSPAPQVDVENKGCVMRRFSSPDPKQVCYRRNSDSFYKSKTDGSKSELDSDLENYEHFEESFIDIDAEPDDIAFGAYTENPEIDGPKKVVTTLLPGSGIQRIAVKPISPLTIQKVQCSRQAKRKHQRDRDENKSNNHINFQPLILNMPEKHSLHSESEQSFLGMEELRRSPTLDTEALELERELDNAEQHLDGEITMATEESDGETAIKKPAKLPSRHKIRNRPYILQVIKNKAERKKHNQLQSEDENICVLQESLQAP